MTWSVRARDTTGAVRTLTRTASSRQTLLADLRAEHLLVLDMTEVRKVASLPPFWSLAWLRPMTGFEVELGLRQIASMLRSGITLLASVEAIAQEALSPWARRTWGRVAARIVRGGGFAEALSQEPKYFSELVVRLAEVGERSGELELAVTRAADQLEARRNLRTQVINALVYPVLAVMMALGVSVFLVVAVIPKVAEFLRAGGAQLPVMTQMLMDVSDWVNQNGLIVLAGLAAVVAAWIVVRFNPFGREAEDVLLLHIPLTGRILRLSATSLFSRSMQIMTESGVTLLDALSTAAQLMPNRRHRRRVVAAHEAVMNGKTLADGLRSAHEFMPTLLRMASVGEATGSLPEAFSESARFNEMLLALAVKRFGMMIEPVMIVITGGIVGFVYISFFMAIFAISGIN